MGKGGIIPKGGTNKQRNLALNSGEIRGLKQTLDTIQKFNLNRQELRSFAGALHANRHREQLVSEDLFQP